MSLIHQHAGPFYKLKKNIYPHTHKISNGEIGQKMFGEAKTQVFQIWQIYLSGIIE